MKRHLLLRIASMALAGLMTFQTAFVDTGLYVYASNAMSTLHEDMMIEDTQTEDNMEVSSEEDTTNEVVEDEVSAVTEDAVDIIDELENIDIDMDDSATEEENISVEEQEVLGVNETAENIYLHSKKIYGDKITISWGMTEKDADVASYDVFRDGVFLNNVKANSSNDNTYTDKGLETLEEYVYTIQAKDAEGTVVGKSNSLKLGFYEDIYVDGPMVLDRDMVVNSIGFKASYDFDLNGHTLVVLGDATAPDSSLRIIFNGGRFECNNLSSYNDMYLEMKNSNDYLLVNGNLSAYDFYVKNDNAGTIEVKGDITAKTSYYYYYNPADTFKTILSGYKKQVISFRQVGAFGELIVKNNSEEGVIFEYPHYASNISFNDSKVSMATSKECVTGWTLNDYEVIEGDLVLNGGELNLNGHTLYIKGSLYQMSGVININGGYLVVENDYISQYIKDSGEKVDTAAILLMNNENDYVKVGGDYIWESGVDHSKFLSNGTLEVHGNIKTYSRNSNNRIHKQFASTDDFILLLNGDDEQIVDLYYSYGSSIANLVIMNLSGKVKFPSGIYVKGSLDDKSNLGWIGNIILTDSAIIKSSEVNGNIYISEGKISIDKEISINGELYLSNGTLEINAPVIFEKGISIPEYVYNGNTIIINDKISLNGNITAYDLLINENAEVDGDLIIRNVLNINGKTLRVKGNVVFEKNATLDLKDKDSSLIVDGSFSYNSSEIFTSDTGSVSVGANFACSLSNFKPVGEQVFIFNGSAAQVIDMGGEEPESKFNKVIIENTSKEGVSAPFGLYYESLDNRTSAKIEGDVNDAETFEGWGYTLEKNVTIDGDFCLKGGKMILDGYTLIVNGDFLHKGGELIIGDGHLIVNGNYILQSDALTGSTTGQLKMNGAEGVMTVTGDVVINASVNTKDSLLAGVLEVGGNFTQIGVNNNFNTNDSNESNNTTGGVLKLPKDNNYNFVTSSNFILRFNGKTAQTVTIGDQKEYIAKSCSEISNIEFLNTSSEGVTIVNPILVTASILDHGNVVNGAVAITERTILDDNNFSGSVILTSEKNTSSVVDYTRNMIIGADMKVATAVRLSSTIAVGGEFTVSTRNSSDVIYILDKLEVEGDIILNKGKLYVNDSIIRCFGDLYENGGYISNYNSKVTSKIYLNNYYINGVCDDYRSNLDIYLTGDLIVNPELGFDNPASGQKGELFSIDNTSFLGYDGTSVTLCGDKKQIVEFPYYDDRVDILVITNTSEEGIYAPYGLHAGKVDNLSNAPIVDPSGFIYIDTLEDNITIDGDCILGSSALNLNGYTLTVEGNLIQLGGSINFNGGNLIVKGDYRCFKDNEEIWGKHTMATMEMTGAADYMLVYGDFYYDLYSSKFTNGTIELKGDMIFGERVMVAESSHTIVFSGDKKQNVLANNEPNKKRVQFSNIKNNNSGADVFFDSIYIVNDILLNGNEVSGTIYIGKNTKISDNYLGASLAITGYAGQINEKMTIDGNLIIEMSDYNYREEILAPIIVKGDIYINKGSLTIGDDVICEGDFYCGANGLSVDVSKKDANLEVFGNFYAKQSSFISKLKLHGDYVYENSYDLVAFDTIELVGDKKQSLISNGKNISIKKLIINNTSEEGVYFDSVSIRYDTLINNTGAKINGVAGSREGWTLNADTEIDENLCISGGELDLAGHTLTVNGDFELYAGTLRLNKGKLIVNGNLYVHEPVLDENNEIQDYKASSAYIYMENPEDKIFVARNMYIRKRGSGNLKLDSGSFEVKGNFTFQDTTDGYAYFSSEYNANYEDGFQLILSGDKKQTVSFNTDSIPTINALIVKNISTEGVAFTKRVSVTSWLSDVNGKITKDSVIVLDSRVKLADDAYNCGISINSSYKLSKDLTVNGVFRTASYVSGVVDLNGFNLEVGEASIAAPLKVNNGHFVVKGKTSIANAIYMNSEADYVELCGDVIFSGTSSINDAYTAGTLVIKGDVNQISSSSVKPFECSDTHKTILTGKADGSVQSINFSNEACKFNILSLEKDEKYYSFNPSLDKICNSLNKDILEKDDVAPAVPQNLTCEDKTDVSAKLSWDAVEDSDILGYEIYRNNVKVGVSLTNSFTDTGLMPATEYTYEVCSFDISGNRSVRSTKFAVTTLGDEEKPTAPSGLTMSRVTGSSIYIQWNASTDNIGVVGYKVYRDEVLIATIGNICEYHDKDLDIDSVYEYTVTAYDKAGNESNNSNKLLESCSLPKIIGVTPAKGTTIGGRTSEVSVLLKRHGWSQEIYNVEFEYKNQDSSKWTRINKADIKSYFKDGSTIIANTYWELENVGSGIYDIRVTVSDTDGFSAIEEYQIEVDKNGPEVVTDFVVSSVDGLVNLSWSESLSNDCVKYKVYRALAVDGRKSLLATITTNSYVDKRCELGTKYYYWIVGVDSFGQEGELSECKSTVVIDDTQAPSVTFVKIPTKAINGKYLIEAEGTDNKTVASMSLYYRINDTDEWTVAVNNKACAMNIASLVFDTTVVPDGKVYLKVVAKDAAGNSSDDIGASKEIVVTVDNTGVSKVTVKNVSVDISTVTLEWDDVPEQDLGSFSVYRKVGNTYVEVKRDIRSLGCNITDLFADTDYVFAVAGLDVLGNRGEYSDDIVVHTKKDTKGPIVYSFGPRETYFNKTIPISISARDESYITNAVFEYSQDRENWFEYYNYYPYQSLKDVKINGNLDINQLNLVEGEVFVRVYVYDVYGNVSKTDDGKPIENNFIIDRVAPDTVTELEAEGMKGYNQLKWAYEPKEDFGGFIVERAELGSDNFKEVAHGFNDNSFEDRYSVVDGITYAYRVRVADQAGNISDPSEVVYAQSYADDEKPIIINTSPLSGSLLNSNTTISAYVKDNVAIKNVKFFYKKEDVGTWKTLADISLNINVNQAVVDAEWDVSSIENGTYEIKIIATDVDGNESEEFIVDYTIDTKAPNSFVDGDSETPTSTFTMRANAIEHGAELSWSKCTASDFKDYVVYRKCEGEGDFTIVTRTTSTEYTDTNLSIANSYIYMVAACDKAGNQKKSNTEKIKPLGEDNVKPNAVASENYSARAEQEILFDASASTDDVAVVDYIWDFGNTEIMHGARVRYAYKEEGTYHGSLKVVDAAGNYDVILFTVYVRSNKTGLVHLHVVDTSDSDVLVKLAYAYVYIENKDTGEGLNYIADGTGDLTVVLNPGRYMVSAYIDGYMPDGVELVVAKGDELDESISLEQTPLITGELTTERLTLEEMEKLGVDIQDPNNWFKYKYVYYIVLPGRVDEYVITLEPDGKGGCSGGANGNGPGNRTSSGPDSIRIVVRNVGPATIVTRYDFYSYLKKMYAVELNVSNNAPSGSGYDLEYATATFELPGGLSFLDSADRKSVCSFGTISAGETKSTKWNIRADKAGTYDLSALVTGNVVPFNAPLELDIHSYDPLVVTDKEDNTFDDPGFITGEPVPHYIFVKNKEGDNVQGAIVTLTHIDSGKKSQTITNSNGRAIVHIDSDEKRVFELEIRHKDYPTFKDDYKPEGEKATFILYRPGETREESEKTIKLINANLNGESAMDEERLVSLLSRESYKFDFEFNKEIESYSLSVGVGDGHSIINSKENDNSNKSMLSFELSANDFRNYYGGFYEGYLHIQVTDKKGNTEKYDLKIYAQSTMFESVIVTFDGKPDVDVMKDSLTIHKYLRTTDNVDNLHERFRSSFFDTLNYEVKKIWFEAVLDDSIASEGIDLSQYDIQLVHGLNSFSPTEGLKFELTTNKLDPKYKTYLVVKKNKTIISKVELNIIVEKRLVPLKEYDIDLFSNSAYTFVLPEDVPLLGGKTIRLFDNPDKELLKIKANVEIDEEDNLHVQIYKLLGTDTSGMQERLKTKDGKESRREVRGFDWNLAIFGELVANPQQDRFTGDLMVYAGLGYGYTKNFMVGSVPVIVKVNGQLIAGNGAEMVLTIDDEGKKAIEFAFQQSIKFALTVFAGVGIDSLADLGVYGYGAIQADWRFDPDFCFETVTLEGEIGLRADVFKFEADFPLVAGTYVIDFRDPIHSRMCGITTDGQMFMDAVINQSLSKADNYSYPESEEEQSWLGESINTNRGVVQKIQSNAASYTKPKIISNGEKTVVFFEMNRAGYDIANNSRIAYAVMNKDGSFGAPKFISDSEFAQYNYDLYETEDGVYVIYQEANKKLATNIGLVETAEAMELKAVKYSYADNSITELGSSITTNNNICELNNNIVAYNGEVYSVWSENAENNIFGESNNNIYYSQYDSQTNTWSEKTAIVATDYISSIDAGVLDGHIMTAYEVADKGHLVDLTDNSVIEISVPAKNMQFTKSAGQSVLSWYSAGAVYKKAAGAEEINVTDNVYIDSSNYQIISDNAGHSSIVYNGVNNNSSDIYISDLDIETGHYSYPVKITSQNENSYLEKLDGAYINGSLALVFNDTTATVHEGKVNRKSDMGIMYVTKNVELSFGDVIFEHTDAIPGAEVPVSVIIYNNGLKEAIDNNVRLEVIDSAGKTVYSNNLSASILAGGVLEENIVLKMPYSLTSQEYKFVLRYDDHEIVKNITMGYSDLAVYAYPELHSGVYSVVAKVSNKGMEAADGTVTFIDKLTNTELTTENVNVLEYGEDTFIEYIIDSSVYDGSKDCYIGVQINTNYHQERLINDYSEIHLYGMDTRPIYSVTFDYGLANKVAESRYVYANDTIKLPEVPAVDGYKFIGWFTASDVQFTEETPVNDDLLLVAKFVEDQSGSNPTPTPTPDPVVPTPTPDPTPDVPSVDPTVNPFDGYANKVFVGEKKDISGLFANVVKPEGQKLYYRIVDAPVKKMASVSNKGMFLPKKPGKVSVELYYVEKKVGENGKKTKVKTPLSKVEISILKLGVNESAITATYSGKTVDLNEMMVFNDGTKTVSGNSIIPDIVKDGMTVTYASSNKKVATVDEKGVITVGDKSGKSTIMIKLVTPNKRKINIKVKLTVKIPAFAKKAYSVKVGKTVKTKMKNLVDSNKIGIVYAIADTNIATVDSATGVITGVGIGETEIIATVEGRQYRSTVKVK